MDIEQSLIRNESFNDNEIRFFSETDDVVTAISSLYEQDQDQVVDDSSNETNEVVDADSNNETNEFFSLEELKALFSINIGLFYKTCETSFQLKL